MQIRSLGKLGNRLLYTLTVTAIVIIILVITSAIAIRSYLNENIQGQRTLDRIEESANHLSRSLIDQETGQRGYILTKDRAFLEPYELGLKQFNEQKSQLSESILDFPSLSNDLKLFLEQGENWQRQYGSTLIEMVENGEQPSIEQLRDGKEVLDSIRALFANFSDHIEAERTIVRNKMQNGINNTLFSLVLTIIVIILINLLLNIRLLKTIIKPIYHLNSCVKSYTQHDFSQHVPKYKKNDELLELIQNVDIMRNELSNNISLLEAKANLDVLTGLYNRRYLNENVHKNWEMAKEQSSNFSVMIIDIDYYKKYNDTYGHLAGDESLKQVAKCLQKFAAEPDSFVARYGGEEFCIVIVHQKGDEAFERAEQIRKAVQQLKIKHESSLIHEFLTVSVGVVTLVPEGELQPKDVFTMADKALYESKQNGRNLVIQY